MEIDLSGVAPRIQGLSDLELATLISLVAKEHCLIEAEEGLLDDVARELALIATDLFNLSYAILSPPDYRSNDAFVSAILERDCSSSIPNQSARHSSIFEGPYASENASLSPEFYGRQGKESLDARRIVNVVIAKDFNHAPDDIQIQGLELVRLRRIFSRTAVHAAHGVFLLLPLCSDRPGGKRMNKYLIDRIFISHYHAAAAGFPNLEEADAYISDAESSSSVIRKPRFIPEGPQDRKPFGSEDIGRLQAAAKSTTMSAEVRRYLQNIVVFLRMERGVGGGISPHGTAHFEALTRILAPLHGVKYVTPSLVALAAKKIYRHRLILSSLKEERSMQYGSDAKAVHRVLQELTAEDIVETVLNKVTCPL